MGDTVRGHVRQARLEKWTCVRSKSQCDDARFVSIVRYNTLQYFTIPVSASRRWKNTRPTLFVHVGRVSIGGSAAVQRKYRDGKSRTDIADMDNFDIVVWDVADFACFVAQQSEVRSQASRVETGEDRISLQQQKGFQAVI